MFILLPRTLPKNAKSPVCLSHIYDARRVQGNRGHYIC